MAPRPEPRTRQVASGAGRRRPATGTADRTTVCAGRSWGRGPYHEGGCRLFVVILVGAVRETTVTPRLIITDGPRRDTVELGTVVVIGRDPVADVVLSSDNVSGRHALLTCDDTALRIVDLDSDSGTRVNGRPITRPSPLRDGDTVTLADVECVVDLSDCPRMAGRSPAALDPPGVRGPARPRDAARRRTVLLSHARADQRRARWLRRGLEHRFGWDVWMDVDDAGAAPSRAADLERVMAEADVVLLLRSRHTTGSAKVDHELASAAEHGRPVVVADLDEVSASPGPASGGVRWRYVAVSDQRGDEDCSQQLARLDRALLDVVQDARSARRRDARLAIRRARSVMVAACGVALCLAAVLVASHGL